MCGIEKSVGTRFRDLSAFDGTSRPRSIDQTGGVGGVGGGGTRTGAAAPVAGVADVATPKTET